MPIPTLHPRRQACKLLGGNRTRKTRAGTCNHHVVESQTANSRLMPGIEIAIGDRRRRRRNPSQPATRYLQGVHDRGGIGAIGSGLNQHTPLDTRSIKHLSMGGRGR